MRALAICALFLLAGCASLSDDLQAVRAKCSQTPAMAPFITCLNGVEDPVFQKDSPEDLPAYRQFAAARLDLAQQLDAGKITPTQFTAATAQAREKFTASVESTIKARQAELDRKRDADAVEALQGNNKPGTGPSMGDMSGMSNMGMGM